MDDWKLLNQYVQDGSEEAFEELVKRYSNMVYASALRRIGPKEADDVTQAVFFILARKAPKMRQKSAKSLAGWLYKTTRYAASEAARSRQRRHEREETAMEIQQMITEEQKVAGQVREAKQVLDSVLDKLNTKDREAIVLRFFQGASYAEVGAAIGTTENTATKRIARALEKMRSSFTKKGIAMSIPLLSNILSVECAESAAPELIKTCTSIAIGSAEAGEVGLLAGTAAKVMFIEQAKVVAATACTAAALGTGTLVAAHNYVLKEEPPPTPIEETAHLTYKGKSVLPDNTEKFQINTGDNGKTYFVGVGDVVEGFTVKEHRTKTEERIVPGIPKPQKVKISELVLTKGNLEIVIGKESQPSQQKTSRPHSN